MGTEIRRLHHVGHIVRDLGQALELYRRLGFDCAPPTYPLISQTEGEPPKPFGVANTHAEFAQNFVELATVVSEATPVLAGAKRLPLQVPPAALPRVLETLKRTMATLAQGLSRFEGLHILVFETADAPASASQFDRDGVGHSGVHTVQRPIETAGGMQTVPIRFLEIDREPVPEGRLAVAENAPSEILRAQSHLDHPNGAVALVQAVLCVPDPEVESYSARYTRYLARRPRFAGEMRIFELEGSEVVIVRACDLERLLPGEAPPALPAFVAYAVAVRDLIGAVGLLEKNGLPVVQLSEGGVFVPAAAALGTAVIFRGPHA